MLNESPQRPTAITVICVLGFLGAAITVPGAIALLSGRLALPGLAAIPGWYAPVLLLATLVSVFAFVEMWRMRRVGVYIYTGVFALNLIMQLMVGMFNIIGVIIPLIVVGIGFATLRDMVDGV